MKKERPRRATHGAPTPSPFSAPGQSERELVKLLARIAAEKDYKSFLADDKIPYDGSSKRRPT